VDRNDNWADKLVHLHRAAIAVAGAHDIEEALHRIAETARAITGAEMSAIGVPGGPGERMAHFVIAGLPPEVVERAGEPPMGHGVLGVMLKSGMPVRLQNVADHPAFEGVPAAHPSIRSFLGVPVRSHGEVVGDLYLANKIGGDAFTEEDQRLAEMLAAHAAVSIESLRYHKKNEELALVQARARLAPKIEDDVLQALYGAGLLLDALNCEHPAETASRVQAIQQRLDEAINHLREHLLNMASPAA
jgi:GAF domain-containing protein